MMDRYMYEESNEQPIAICICKQELYEGDQTYQVDDYIICDDSDCFKKLCVEKFGAMYGLLDKEGNVT